MDLVVLLTDINVTVLQLHKMITSRDGPIQKKWL